MYVEDAAWIPHGCSCGVGLAAAAPIQPLAWKPPYAVVVALKKRKKKKKKKNSTMLEKQLLTLVLTEFMIVGYPVTMWLELPTMNRVLADPQNH